MKRTSKQLNHLLVSGLALAIGFSAIPASVAKADSNANANKYGIITEQPAAIPVLEANPDGYDTVYSYDFSTNPLADGWTFVDNDGDGMNWRWNGASEYESYRLNGVSGDPNDYYIYSHSYENETDTAFDCDDWAISPKMTVPQGYPYTFLSFYVKSQDANWPDTFAVYIGSSANISSMTEVLGETSPKTGKFEKYTIDLAAYAGKDIYVAFRHFNSYDEYILGLDQVDLIATNCPFVDVKPGKYYYDPVLWAISHDPQITAGTSATTFSPNQACTRGQIVTFLWKAMGAPEPAAQDNPFTDVKTTDYFYKPILWAVQNNVTAGTTATTFSPNKPCTRAEAMTFLWASQGKPSVVSATNPFSDVKDSAYYKTAILWAYGHNPQITSGTSATTFSPNATCTRGQIITFLYKAFSVPGIE